MDDEYILYTDGGSRGNPGPAAIGYIVEKGGQVVRELGQKIGIFTNNQAEYQALIAGLEAIKEEGGAGSAILCRLDSELLVEQLFGHYRVKDKKLKPLYQKVNDLVRQLGGRVTFEAVPRGVNERADWLVNQALDQS